MNQYINRNAVKQNDPFSILLNHHSGGTHLKKALRMLANIALFNSGPSDCLKMLIWEAFGKSQQLKEAVEAIILSCQDKSRSLELSEGS